MAKDFRRKKTFKRRRSRRMPLVKLIKKVIISTAEKKYLPFVAMTTNLIAGTPFSGVLNIISGGSGIRDRVGNDILPNKIVLRYNMTLESSSTNALVRVYIIQALEQDDPQDLPGVQFLMPPLADALNPYRILYDRTHQLGLGVNEILVRQIHVKGSKMSAVKYFDNIGGNFTEGRITIHFVTSNLVPDNVTAQFDSRFHYTDL